MTDAIVKQCEDVIARYPYAQAMILNAKRLCLAIPQHEATAFPRSDMDRALTVLVGWLLDGTTMDEQCRVVDQARRAMAAEHTPLQSQPSGVPSGGMVAHSTKAANTAALLAGLSLSFGNSESNENG